MFFWVFLLHICIQIHMIFSIYSDIVTEIPNPDRRQYDSRNDCNDPCDLVKIMFLFLEKSEHGQANHHQIQTGPNESQSCAFVRHHRPVNGEGIWQWQSLARRVLRPLPHLFLSSLSLH